MKIICLFLFLTQMESILLLPAASAYKLLQDPPVTRPGCIEKCGEVLIPFPFGIGSNCSQNIDFEISCNSSSRFSKPFLRKLNIEVTNISWSRSPRDDLQRITVKTVPQNVCVSSSNIAPSIGSIDLVGSPYRFSTNYNVFMVEGCSGSVILKNRRGEKLTGCASVCSSNNITDDGKMTKCKDYGIGCCFHSISDQTRGLDFYQVAINEEATAYSQTCHIVASLVYNDSVSTFLGKLSSLEPVSIVLDWHAADVQANNLSTCYGASESRYCHCNDRNSPGNPYLPHGCIEYDRPDDATGECGDRYCSHDHYYTTGCGGSNYCHYVALAFRIGVGLLLVLCGGHWFYQYLNRKMELKQRAKYFKRNGGLLLQQQISSNDNVVEKARIFKVIELEKATDKFNKSRILGQGGQGTVYKGMMEDGKIVAVKKSKKVDESQLEQFINEVVILSQVNHRNVVKLIGCCLETEVPLLVYEFIPNGTLYHHIHDPGEDLQVTWKMRLQIAAESANAVAYLHSSSYPPIYHRDIKSTNILLDDKYRAKVSDFGTSKVINIDQTHVTTCVRGTYGYLDPEYFQSNQFTEKSDVYSFGVVLVELVTGKKPIFPARTGGWISLASEFLVHMESYCLEDILDTRLLDEESKEELMAVAKLARRCLKRNGRRRPTMKEVAMELEEIRAHTVPNSAESSYRETREVRVSDLGASMSFPDNNNNIANCFSIDVERFIAYSY